MNLDNESIKKLRQLILFTIVILIALWNYAIIFEWIGAAFGIVFPFLLGGGIAFVLNVPMSFLEEKIFRNRYLKEKKAAKKIARPVSLVLTIGIVVGVIVLVMFGPPSAAGPRPPAGFPAGRRRGPPSPRARPDKPAALLL